MAPLIENLAEWAHHLLVTLDRQVAATRDPSCERCSTKSPPTRRRRRSTRRGGIQLERAHGGHSAAAPTSATLCSRGSRRTRPIGTPADITLDELHVELFHPADAATAGPRSAAGVPASLRTRAATLAAHVVNRRGCIGARFVRTI